MHFPGGAFPGGAGVAIGQSWSLPVFSVPSGVARLLQCRRGRHQRSSNLAYHDGHYWRSACKHCGVPMLRDRSRTWRPAGEGELPGGADGAGPAD